MVQNNFDIIKKFITGNGISDPDIKKSFKKGKGWSFDLRIGDEYFLSGSDTPENLDDNNQFIIIKPGKFGSLITKEKVCIDNNHIGLISVKFTYKQKGLINVSGFHVDPCYSGNIIFTVFNAGPKDIYIKRDDYVFMICFLELKNNLEDVNSTHDLNLKNFCNEGCSKRDGYTSIPVSMIEGLGGNSLTLMENNSRIERLEFYIKVMGGVALGLIAMSLKNLFG